MKIAIIIGTRPEIIKMSPVIKILKEKKIDFFILHTNQHYTKNLDNVFFQELNLPNPDYNLQVGSGKHGEQTGKMLIKIENILIKEKPDLVLVEGDTNTVLAGALSAAKLHIKIGHIEAGLRSYFKKMPEELNRILTDHCSDYLFSPTKKQRNILIQEGITKNKIFVTGNTVTDAVYQNLYLSKKKSRIMDKLRLKKNTYFLLTLHRPENVDNKKTLKRILTCMDSVYKRFNSLIIFPIHPRTKKRVYEFGLKPPKGIKLIEPVGYMDFLNLQSNSQLIMTDSGGVQEEACILKIPCVTLRENTERPETLKVGSNILVGTDCEKITNGIKKMIHIKNNWKNPFGNGKTAERIVEIICQPQN